MRVRGVAVVGVVVCVLVPLAAACGGGGAQPTMPAASASARVDTLPPAPTPSAPVVDKSGPIQIECGDFHTCAIMPDGTVRCWGRDKGGQLGDLGGDDKPTPIAVPGISNAVSLAISGMYSCAVLADRSVSCWGTGYITNDGGLHTRERPTKVRTVAGVVDLAASGDMTCSMDDAHAITCWGLDPSAKGMHPDTGGGPVANLEVAATHGCVLMKTGKVRCWGEGDWLTAAKPTFARPELQDATELITGDAFGCAFTKKNDVRCWGRNESGQLGVPPDGDSHQSLVVVPGVTDAPKLAAGESTACAIHSDGTVTCWGANSDGEMGIGKVSGDERPQKVPGLTNVDQLCIGSSHACALTKSHEMLCWGTNTAGQLGDGTREMRLSPTRVKF
jgi:alpha-tubulin suppressor-like RCC1 family protein